MSFFSNKAAQGPQPEKPKIKEPDTRGYKTVFKHDQPSIPKIIIMTLCIIAVMLLLGYLAPRLGLLKGIEAPSSSASAGFYGMML